MVSPLTVSVAGQAQLDAAKVALSEARAAYKAGKAKYKAAKKAGQPSEVLQALWGGGYIWGQPGKVVGMAELAAAVEEAEDAYGEALAIWNANFNVACNLIAKLAA